MIDDGEIDPPSDKEIAKRFKKGEIDPCGKPDLTKEVLKTIEANNVKVYHGIITSNNKIPIKVLK